MGVKQIKQHALWTHNNQPIQYNYSPIYYLLSVDEYIKKKSDDDDDDDVCVCVCVHARERERDTISGVGGDRVII